MSVDSALIERLHRVLVEEIREQAPRYLSSPFTVAEIYQSLVPYRTHRDRIGVELNGDYEEAILHLLAGEGDYLQLESEPARRRLEREVETPNPDTGVFREFAAVDVRLNPAKIADEAPELRLEMGDGAEEAAGKQGGAVDISPGSRTGTTPSAAPAAEARSGSGAGGGSGSSPRGQGSPSSTSGPSGSAKAEAGGEGSASAGDGQEDCPECERDLPQREGLRFCPWCGTNVHVAPCSECGEVLDRDWAFCVACGTPSAA